MRSLESLLPPHLNEHSRVVCYCYWLEGAVGSSTLLQCHCLKVWGGNTGDKKDQHASWSFPQDRILDVFLKDSTYCSDPADLTLKLRRIAGPTEWTFLHWLSTVDGPIRCSTDVKRVVHVIIELVGICGVLLTGRQDFAGLKEWRNILFTRTDSCTPQLKWSHHHGLVVSLT